MIPSHLKGIDNAVHKTEPQILKTSRHEVIIGIEAS